MDYKEAGVNVEAGYEAVKLMKEHIKGTLRQEVLTDIGGFSGLFSLANFKYEHPVLVSGTDGVGTKLKIAFILDKHDTIGIDCVAMCVNDIACSGAQPLFFLDYIACGKNNPEKIATIVKGVADGCKISGAALIGGETAEMPGFYPEDEYDLAGFSVGIVDKKNLINGENMEEGDVILGISSSGIHSNGYSLVRKVFEMSKENLDKYYDEINSSLGEELLKPTKIYVKHIQALLEAGIEIKAISHITGGGFYENIPRMLKNDFHAYIDKNSFEILPIFKLLQNKGNISEKDMFNTYNIGIGMAMIMSKDDAKKAQEILQENLDEKGYIIGKIKKGEVGITIC